MTQGTVIWSIVIGIISVGMVAFISYRKGVEDGDIVSISSRLLARIRRGRSAAIARRLAFSLTARLQQVRLTLKLAARLRQTRLTLNPFRLKPADSDGPDELDGSWLHKAARSEIAQLIAALSETQADQDNPGRDRALACYDAAALLAAEREDPLDLIGAVVLAREGQTALAHRNPLPLPACQVNPLHGPAVSRPTPKRRPRPRRAHTVCAACKKCSRPERDKRALLVAGIPYYQTPGFWSAIGFGALDPELPTRVLEYMHVE